MDTLSKLRILSGAARYDAMCASSGSRRNGASSGTANANASSGGICHGWSDDGRCISLLKILLSNDCSYDCAYCVKCRSSQVERVSFIPVEVVSLTLDFYRRNYIEGLFLSSAVLGSPYSAFISVNDDSRLPAQPTPPLLREHRLLSPPSEPRQLVLPGLSPMPA
ncbi:MAG: hypothetical protein A3K90_09200 [Pelodictyon luteolum]|uniref:Uncharacterized protein n=1 Tax=Pelodictyon luteolum TaxID=1100 RepID=A0A165LZJ3_PELLU|nr:MAG: hypothetical protein A3K90_09200 [Pelodictyon luteolum]